MSDIPRMKTQGEYSLERSVEYRDSCASTRKFGPGWTFDC